MSQYGRPSSNHRQGFSAPKEETQAEFLERRQKLVNEASKIESQVNSQILELHPIGIMNEMGLALNIQPPKGIVRRDIVGKPFLFKENHVPSESKINEINRRNQEAKDLRASIWMR